MPSTHTLKTWTTDTLRPHGDLCSKMVQATKSRTVFRGRVCVGVLHVDITGEQPGHPRAAGLVPIPEMCSYDPFPNI